MAKSGVQTKHGSRAADYVNEQTMGHILAALMPANRRVMYVALCTGLRISDVLNIKTEQLHPETLQNCKGIRINIREVKTSVYRRVWLPWELRAEICMHAGKLWAFPGRCDWTRHRTRQAVEKDMQRARKLLRVPAAMTISPHSARKLYAVTHKAGALHHKSKIIEQMYEQSDATTAHKMRGRRSDLYD